GYMIFDHTASSHTTKVGWLEGRINHRALVRNKRGADFLGSAASDLALAVVNLATVLDVDLFVVGGSGFADYGPAVLGEVAAQVSRFSDRAIRIEEAQATEPGVIGAGALAVDSILDRKMRD